MLFTRAAQFPIIMLHISQVQDVDQKTSETDQFDVHNSDDIEA